MSLRRGRGQGRAKKDQEDLFSSLVAQAVRLVFGHKDGGSCGRDHRGSHVIFNGDGALNDVETLFAVRAIMFEKHLTRLERKCSQVSRRVARRLRTEQRLQTAPALVLQ